MSTFRIYTKLGINLKQILMIYLHYHTVKTGDFSLMAMALMNLIMI